MCSAGAEATASQLSKLALTEAKALPEFASEVFWDSMVPISTSIGSLSGCHLRGPYSCSKSSMTSSITTSSKNIIAASLDAKVTAAQSDEMVNLLHEKINSMFIGSLSSVHQSSKTW
jgi:hypothetical protein